MASGPAQGAGAPILLDSLIPPQMLRNLSDRSFDKRKASAMEVEKAVRKLRDAGNIPGVRAVLSVLATDFASSVNSNTRKGGLLALSTAAVGLGEDSAQFSDVLLSPVLRAFNDSDSRLRYYACEAALNVCRVIRGAAYRHVSDLLAGICKLVADTDVEVKNGASLLDRLLKEIVCELGHIDAEVFIPLLRSHMTVNNPYVRQCLVGWITTLDSVPGIDMVDYMPDLLEGLFDMLGDGNREIRQQAYGALSKFLDQISKVPASEFETRVAFRPMVETLISQTAREKDKFNRLTAVEWLTQFILLGRARLAPVYDRLLATVLRCLSDPEAEIVNEATKANNELIQLVRSTAAADFQDTFLSILKTVTTEARAKDRITRSAALRWSAMLLAVSPERVFGSVDDFLASLLSNLLDSDDADVLRLNLEVLARLSVYNLTFLRTRILKDLIRLFAENRALLEAKAAFILRRLCLMLEPTVIYISMAKLLVDQPNREFASLMVELMNLILLTAIELTSLRDVLRGCASPFESDRVPGLTVEKAALKDAGEEDVDSETVFMTLYRTWCINPVASFSLCLLANAYELGSKIVGKFAETTISVGVLMQVDKLVQLLETPIFLQTRLHLTQPERPDHQYLLRSLYGLLMMMPQGTAFFTLRDRLHSVSALHVAVGMQHVHGHASTTATSSFASGAINLGTAFDFFTECQRKQRETLAADLKSRSLLHRYQQQLQQSNNSAAAITSVLAPTEQNDGALDAGAGDMETQGVAVTGETNILSPPNKGMSLREMLRGSASEEVGTHVDAALRRGPQSHAEEEDDSGKSSSSDSD